MLGARTSGPHFSSSLGVQPLVRILHRPSSVLRYPLSVIRLHKLVSVDLITTGRPDFWRKNKFVSAPRKLLEVKQILLLFPNFFRGMENGGVKMRTFDVRAPEGTAVHCIFHLRKKHGGESGYGMCNSTVIAANLEYSHSRSMVTCTISNMAQNNAN